MSDWGELALADRGIDVPHEIDLQLRVMEQLGVPASAIDILDREQDSTADESDALRAIAGPRHWSRVIVVTSKQHTRRAGLAMRRKLAGTGITITMRASRYDRSDAEHWWRTGPPSASRCSRPSGSSPTGFAWLTETRAIAETKLRDAGDRKKICVI